SASQTGLTALLVRRILLPMRDDETPKRLIVVGDRVLISPEEGEERTNVGLYLPPTALESRQVQGGRIVATGPGTPMTEPASMDDEAWKATGRNGSCWMCTRSKYACPGTMSTSARTGRRPGAWCTSRTSSVPGATSASTWRDSPRT